MVGDYCNYKILLKRGAMRLTYDPRHNIAYIRFGKKQGEVETIKVSEELCIDLSPDGKV